MIEDSTIIQTDFDSENGQNKCEKCGSTDISYSIELERLVCNFCKFEIEGKPAIKINDDITTLIGEEIGLGITDIDTNFDNTITIACDSCGAEVIVETSESLTARCHWCRNTLSINKILPNGAVPDAVLPFKVLKKDAGNIINDFAKNRSFFAHPKFKAEFEPENIMGVFFPYMTVDVNAHASFLGQGEKLKRRYTVKVGKSTQYRYDADSYFVSRDFDVMINDLTIEANTDRLNNVSSVKTNNIINAVMPFDIKNCVKWDANYLKGYTSEKRDVNIDFVRNIVNMQAKDVARFKINSTLSFYDRGVRWQNQDFDIKGQRWNAVYLPIWLYSYHNKGITHYVAVNGRTKEVMGSIPIHMPKLLFVSTLVEMFGLFLSIITINDETILNFLFLAIGFLYFGYYTRKYRNSNARHRHEVDTEATMDNVKQVDNFVMTRKGLSNSKIMEMNNFSIDSNITKDSIFF